MSFPEVLVRWHRPDPPMRGTPAQPDGAQSGSIKLLGKPMDRGKQLREERRKQRRTGGSRGGSTSGDRGGGTDKLDRGIVRAEAVMAMFRADEGGGPASTPVQEERPGRVPASARVSLLVPRQAASNFRSSFTDNAEEDEEHDRDESPRGDADPPRQLPPATRESVILEVEQPEEREVAAEALGIVEARTVAAQVRAQAARVTSEAWASLRREFDVQCEVWQSMAFRAAAGNKGQVEEPEKRPEAQVRARLEALLLEAADANSRSSSDAILAFAAAVKEDAQKGRHLSKSVANAVVEAERAQPVSEARHVLSRHLEAVASSKSSRDKLETRHEFLEKMVSASRLEDVRVEYCARRVLGLSMCVGSYQSGDKCQWARVGDSVREGFLSGSWGSQSTEPWA